MLMCSILNLGNFKYPLISHYSWWCKCLGELGIKASKFMETNAEWDNRVKYHK